MKKTMTWLHVTGSFELSRVFLGLVSFLYYIIFRLYELTKNQQRKWLRGTPLMHTSWVRSQACAFYYFPNCFRLIQCIAPSHAYHVPSTSIHWMPSWPDLTPLLWMPMVHVQVNATPDPKVDWAWKLNGLGNSDYHPP